MNQNQQLLDLYDKISSDINNIAQTIQISCKVLKNFHKKQITLEEEHRNYQNDLKSQCINFQNNLYNNHYKLKNIEKQIQNPNQNHKYQILKMFESQKGQQDFVLFQSNCVDNYICIAALWKSKIVNHFLFQLKQNDEYVFVDNYISLLSECELEKERYDSEFEYDVIRKMKYERLRMVVNKSQPETNESIDQLCVELQQQETIKKMNYPVLKSQFKLYQVMKQIIKEQIEQPGQSYQWAFRVQQIYAKLFKQEKHQSCSYCKLYIAYDYKYEAYLPPLLYQIKTNQVIFYHSQCGNQE